MRLSYISPLTLRCTRGNASITHQAQEVHQAQQVQQAQQAQQTQPHADVPPTTSGPQSTIVSKEDITELAQISELSNVSLTDDRRHVEDIRQRLDKILLKCWIKLNLPVEEMELVTGIPGIL
jgi:cell pole-organizing protein PopZ